MTQGRKTNGVALVEKYEASAIAKARLQAVLDTMSGGKSVVEASRELNISEAMFYRMRDHFLEGAVELLEPQKCGRKPREKDPPEIIALKQEVEELKKQLLGANLREELAVIGQGFSKKTPLPGRHKKKRRRLRK